MALSYEGQRHPKKPRKKAYAAGVCERYSTAAINLCLEDFDKLRLAVVESGASGLEYFSKRIEQDPEGFEQFAKFRTLCRPVSLRIPWKMKSK